MMRIYSSLLLVICLFLFPVRQASATEYYVAPSGNDSNPGTVSSPWQTIQHAADTLAAGDTVYIRSGIYNETAEINVSGSEAGGYITFRRYTGETPVLDGTGLDESFGANGLYINDQSYLRIQGFEIRNYSTTTPGAVPAAIQIEGASHHIQLLDNSIHHIETNAPVDSNLQGADAHGIAIYGTSTSHAISDLLIRGNELAYLKLGSSEALVLNGNVDGFTVSSNLIHDCDNIGLDFIGFEGTVADPSLDRARNGLVADNKVYNIDSRGNPSYGQERSADGIYVDGGQNIIIEQNRVDSCNIGIEIASEHANGNTSAITVRNNFISNSHTIGMTIGGYDSQRGYADNCALVNNTLYHNDSDQTGSGEIQLNYDTRNTTIKNNIVVAGPQSLLIGNPFTQNTGNTVDYNLYFAPAGAGGSKWVWKNNLYTGLASYQAATGNDAHSLFADPGLLNPALLDLHITKNSPAVGRGDNTAPAGTTDIDGQARCIKVIDIGADEIPVPCSFLPAQFLLLLNGKVNRPDGAVQVPLSMSGSLQNPAWSPDSGKLVFTRFRNGYNREPADLFVGDPATGTSGVLVSDNSGNINLPGAVWNTATNQIIFASTRDPHDEIYIIPATGQTGDETQVTSRTDQVAYEPSFSPAGDWIVFESHQLDVEGNGIIFKYKVDKTQPYQALTDPGDDCRQPNWSPAGDHILYQRLGSGQWDIWLMNTDGSAKQQVTSGPGDKTDASFSPDGQQIVYSSDQGGLPHANLFILDLTSKTQTRLTSYPQGYDGAPSWSADGQWIAFESCPSDPELTGATTIWKIAAP